MKDRLIKLGYLFTWFSMKWYQLTMWMTKRSDARVREYASVEEIVAALQYGKLYRYDELFGKKGDHLTHPSALQFNLNNGGKFGDCDDHAIYWCAALLKSGLAKKVWFAFYSMKKGDKYEAHAVCVFEDMNHELNWCDYGMPNKIERISDFQVLSAQGFGKEALGGVIWHVTHLKDDDTPVFGKITRVLP